MNKLQIRVDRADAELIARALRYLGERWDDAPKRGRAIELATWIDHRVMQYFGALRPEPPAVDLTTLQAVLDARKRAFPGGSQ